MVVLCFYRKQETDTVHFGHTMNNCTEVQKKEANKQTNKKKAKTPRSPSPILNTKITRIQSLSSVALLTFQMAVEQYITVRQCAVTSPL